ncbi:hypothetical protein P280DRAFT_172557 [Massarina eburnea CBS 473.64]|uniref:Secreted protein n=1 Tax=Massarina eburnea CBS 473.64 TaxID=1395130 RepID=A0A6A6SB52_9PLEO|nr:hypothetical protein P280DRAFT_172557 [Massarina eburnea CBS 473.64]
MCLAVAPSMVVVLGVTAPASRTDEPDEWAGATHQAHQGTRAPGHKSHKQRRDGAPESTVARRPGRWESGMRRCFCVPRVRRCRESGARGGDPGYF